MKLVLIGGGEIGKAGYPYETKEIDQEIVKLSGKDKPNFLFIGLASSHADSYYDVIKKVYQNLGCESVYLKKSNLVHNPELVKKKFQEADIIYIGGGDTLKLKERVEEYHLKSYFAEAMKKNTVLAGISAGAILLSKEGYSDSYILRGESDKYSFVEGFHYFNESITPHYHRDPVKMEQLKEELSGTSKEVYGIENGCALVIEDEKIRVISSLKDANVYLVSNKDMFLEKKI